MYKQHDVLFSSIQQLRNEKLWKALQQEKCRIKGFIVLGNPLLFVSVGWFVPVWVVLCLCLRVKLPNLCQLCVHIHVDNFSKVTRQTAILYLSMQAKGFMSCTVPNISCTMTLRTSRPRRWTKSSEKRQCPRFFCHER